MIITREKGMRMWGGGSGSTSASGVNGGGGFSLAVTEGEGTGNAYTGFTYESGVLSLIKGEKFVTVDFFNRLFTAYDSDGNAILPNDVTSTINNLKLLVGTWTDEYLSALGKNSEGGGGGGVDLTAVWASLTNTDSPTYSETLKININHIPNIGWSKIDNKPTTLSGYGITDAKIANGTITLGSNTITPLTASSSLSWSKLTGTPTTLAGYGIGDAKIANGVITLGSSTITPVTSVAMTVPTGFSVSGSPISKTGTLTLAYATGYEGFTTALKEKIEALYSWFEVDANGDVKTKDTAGGHVRGFYTESFVSALGSNSSGGGSGAGLEDVWDSLTNQQGTVITDNTKIAIAHIPDTSSTYGYLKSSALNGYATQSWVNQQGFLTTHQTIYALTLKAGGTAVTTFTPNSADASLDFVAGTNISLTRGTNQITIANTYSYTLPLAASGTRGGVQIGYSETNSGTSSTRNYAVKLSSEKMYVNVPWTDTTYKLTLNGTTNGASGGTSLGSLYAPTASGTANQVLISGGSNTAPSWTAQSNLSVGTAAKLNTGTTTYTAWGQTYWSSGVPQSISGNMTSVGSITPSANGNALGTTSARFNIYGTSGNFSGNVSITGTLGVTGATTLSSTLSVAGGITLTTTKRIYFGDTSHYLEFDSTGFHFSHGVYSDSFVSALGANSSGGGSGTFDEEAMWTALGTTITAKVIASSHIPNLSWNKITSNKPTTLSGYGITNAYTKTEVDNALSGYLPLSGGNMTGNITFASNTGFYAKDTGGTARLAMKLDGTDNLLIGYGTSIGGSNTYIDGNTVYIRYGASHTTGITLASGGNVTIANRLLVNEITATNSEGLLVYKPSSGWGGISNTQWGAGSADSQGVIRSSNADLIHYKGGVNYTILDSSNHGDYAYALYGGTAITGTSSSHYDLNNLLTVGSYYCAGSATAAYIDHKPISDNLAFRIWVTATTGTASGNYLRQRFQAYTRLTVYERVAYKDSGLTSSDWGEWYLVQNSLANYLPLTGGTITGNLISTKSGTAETYFRATNSNGSIELLTSTNRGVYDRTTATWLIGTNGTNTWLSQGNVGIGTTSPVYKLDVVGSIRASDVVYVGTGGAAGNSYVASDEVTNIYLRNSSGAVLVCDGKVVRRGTTLSNVTLGSSSYPWLAAYATTFYGALNGNASTATTLATPRTIWGQSFDGSSDVSGSITGATTITASGRISASAFEGDFVTDGTVFYFGDSQHAIGSGTDAVLWAYGANSLLFYTNNLKRMTIDSGGSVGIGTSSPSYKLHVAGTVGISSGHLYLTGAVAASSTANTTQIIFTASGTQQVALSSNSGSLIINPTSSTTTKQIVLSVGSNVSSFGNSITCSGEVTASSDGRKKNIISNTKFNVKDIASARSVLFEWNDGRDDDMEKKIHGGSIAQDWLGKADSFLSQDNDGLYSINYGALALCSAITIAREVLKHEDRITKLERENAYLKNRVNELERRIA